MIARRIENLLALDYPARASSRSSSPRTPRPTAPRSSPRAPGVRVIRNPRGGKVAAQDRAVRADRRRRSSRSRTRTRPGRPTRCAGSCALRRSGGRLRLRAAAARGAPTARTGRASTGATRWPCARAESQARLGHGRQRLDLRGAPLRLRRGRPALRPRSLASLPHGAARPPGGLRARGATRARSRRRSNETEYRRKVRMFEHCWLIVLRGKMLRRLGPLYTLADRLAPSPALRLGPAPPRPARDVDRARLARLVLRRRARGPARAARSPRRAGRRDRALLRARHVGDASSRSWNYLRRGVPATWEAAEGTLR